MFVHVSIDIPSLFLCLCQCVAVCGSPGASMYMSRGAGCVAVCCRVSCRVCSRVLQSVSHAMMSGAIHMLRSLLVSQSFAVTCIGIRSVCCVSVRVCLLFVASILLLVVHMQGFGNVFAVGTAGCSVLQCDAVCCSGMQCVAVCSMWCDTVCCIVMLCDAV